jgi:hypothetical protein
MEPLKMAEAAPVSRNGFEYSFYTWQMSYNLDAVLVHKCQACYRCARIIKGLS